MIHIVAKSFEGPNSKRCRLPFYLSIEEWAARTLPPEQYFFTWRVEPTVIIGRNQQADKEVNLEYCREHGIELYRRRSGGGCVYADTNNLMLSHITPATEVASTFADYTNQVAEMLKSLGLDASATGRNDVLIGKEKVSGNAFYHLPGRSILHGTMLYDVDIDTMANAITPSKSKLKSNGVKSVSTRVTSVSRYMPAITLDAFERYIIDYFTDATYQLSDADLKAIHEIEQRYYDLKWTFGRRGILGAPKQQKRVARRIIGVGDLNMIISLDHERIDDIELTGDFFLLSDLDSMLFDKIRGCRVDAAELSAALADTDVSSVIAGLSADAFISMLTAP